MVERVNHPEHYGGDVTHEVWKCLEAWGLHLSAYAWTTVKYIARAGKKDPALHLEDLQKARWYLDKEIARVKREPAPKVMFTNVSLPQDTIRIKSGVEDEK